MTRGRFRLQPVFKNVATGLRDGAELEAGVTTRATASLVFIVVVIVKIFVVAHPSCSPSPPVALSSHVTRRSRRLQPTGPTSEEAYGARCHLVQCSVRRC